MPKIDVTDEAVIDAPPMIVYKAILNEYAGVTHWWLPIFESKLRGEIPIGHVGAIVDITLHLGRGVTSKMTAKTTKIVEGKLMEEEIAGDSIGTGTWTFEPIDGKTKVQYRYNARTNRLLASLLSPFVNIGKGHSDVMQTGFKACNSYLCKK